MLRQRIRTRTSPLAFIQRLLELVLALALIWYGLILAGLALDVIGGGDADRYSGYRTAYDFAEDLLAARASDTARLIAGVAGLIAFLLFLTVAYKQLPRPYLARSEVELEDGASGVVTVAPRAVERMAEGIALEHPAVVAASGRFGTDDLAVLLEVRRARDLSHTLRAVQQRIISGLERHGLPAVPVNVTLTGYDRSRKRELN
ncbi:MAG TPA: hypothetical protein VGR11_02860 [Solirubrobacteraceae bacterium]|nr:hypothetical protein [Solirubrobacteraceae bacterium]